MLIFLLIRPPPTSTLFPYTTLFRSGSEQEQPDAGGRERLELLPTVGMEGIGRTAGDPETDQPDHIRHAVERAMDAVCLHADGIGEIAVEEFRSRDAKIQPKDNPEDQACFAACGVR